MATEDVSDGVRLLLLQTSQDTTREIMAQVDRRLDTADERLERQLNDMDKRLDELETILDQLWDEQQRRHGSRDMIKFASGVITAILATGVGYLVKLWLKL